MDCSVEIRSMQDGDVDFIFTGLMDHDVQKPRAYVERCWQENLSGQRTTFLAVVQGKFAGWGHLVYVCDYSFFREHGIPEIQNFDVIPTYRRRGVGTQLMDAIEAFAFTKFDVIGIGFGLYASDGVAQKMYVKRGYIPDGRGLMSHNEPVSPGHHVQAGDDLVLFLTKRNPING